MHRNDHPTAPGGVHSKGDVARGTPPTVVTHDLMNALQEEIAHTVEAFLGPLVKADNYQLKKAIEKVVSTSISNGDYVKRPELGDAAFKNTGTGANQVAVGNHTHADLAAKNHTHPTYAGAGLLVQANTVLSAAQVGNWVEINSNSVVTLPSVYAVPAGSTFTLRNSSPTFEPVAINSQGGNVGGVPTFSMGSGELIEFAADPNKGWWITSRSQAFSAFAGTLIGVPIPYPGPWAPPGYVLMAGQPFNTAVYPELAQVYTSGVLPDLRGEFIRGWDNGRGVVAQGLLQWLPQQTVKHSHVSPWGENGPGPFGNSSNNGYAGSGRTNFDNYLWFTNDGSDWNYAGQVNPPDTLGSETRPRSMAFNFICRAR